jgi:1-aminocyclopropane-1-carboxylate deaminase/D-cysteine desulfhydrase-like pyridoxal-dependent ACC family enzyme
MNERHAQSPENIEGLRLGNYPTPLWRLGGSDGAAHDLWIKDDGRTADLYGGNKVRKLERLLAAARQRRATRLLTVGAAGSHHVLATCVHGARAGFATHAVLTPQPWSAHAEATLRAGLNAGLSATPARGYLGALATLRRERRPGDFVIGPGGAGVEGTWAYCLAVDELREQLLRQAVPELDAIVVAAGSGSTAAGLLAGILRTGAARRIIAVQVVSNPALRTLVIGQASCALWRHDHWIRPVDAVRSLRIDARFVGEGYGHSIAQGERATELARSFGLELEPTYTAKAFAAALSWANPTPHDPRNDKGRCDNRRCKLRLHRRRTYLYWHTLSAVPLTPLLAGAPETLPRELAHLLFEPSLRLPSSPVDIS